MNAITAALYAVSNAMLVPVALALLGLTVLALALLGGALREWPARRRWARERRQTLADLRAGRRRSDELAPTLRHFPRGAVLPLPPAVAEVVLHEAREHCRRSLALTSFGSRVGPGLGLMGTLIPLGPALTALASGEIGMLAQGLVVAFTTTVLGLLAGLLCFGVGLVRTRWFADDLFWLELLSTSTLGAGADGDTAS